MEIGQISVYVLAAIVTIVTMVFIMLCICWSCLCPGESDRQQHDVEAGVRREQHRVAHSNQSTQRFASPTESSFRFANPSELPRRVVHPSRSAQIWRSTDPTLPSREVILPPAVLYDGDGDGCLV